MRYIRQQYILTTTCDEDIKDKEKQTALLKVLSSSDISVAVSFIDATGTERKYSDVRIKALTDKGIDIFVTMPQGRFTLTKIPLEKVTEIKTVLGADNIIVGNEDVSNIDLLNISQGEKDAE